METNRRDLLKLAGGAAVGIVFTPVPWRLITDAALWSENWPGTPQPAHGPLTARYTNCSLCPAGCAVRARCISNRPIGMAGVAGHPLSQGALCALGLAGHQAPYHPDRLKPASASAAPVAQAIAKGGVAVLDLRPGRTASWTYRRAMAAVKGLYVTAPQPLPFAYNLSAARTVLSIGAPLIDGWGTPGNVLRARAGFHLIQADSVESRSASLADTWLRINPGSEPALALGLAQILLQRKPKAVPAGMAEAAAQMTPARTADATALSEKEILDLADALFQNGPSVVVAGEAAPEAAALNALLGGWGQAVVARQEAPVPESWKTAAPATELASVPDGSIHTLLIDESAPGDYIPWGVIAKKLARGSSSVIVFSWSGTGYARHANLALPTAVFPEALDDLPAPADSPAAAFRLSAPLVEPPAGVVNPVEVIAKAAGIDASAALRERADAIHKTARGNLFRYADGVSTPVKDLKPEDFWNALNEGGCWIDTAQAGAPPLPKWVPSASAAGGADLAVTIVERRFAGAPGSPLMSKVYKESNLQLGPNRAALNPATAAGLGLADGARAALTTAAGSCEIEVILDPAVSPGALEVAAGPEVLDICGAFARAKVVRA